VQRSIGSMFALASSRGIWHKATRGLVPSARLRKAFPSGLYSTTETKIRLYEDLPEKWPRKGLFICAADLYSGKRAAFGHPDAPKVPLPDAVLASTAIPGVFSPVQVGDRQYVDGGAYSATSLDLAADAGCRTIICISPLGYRNEGEAVLRDPALWGPMITRSFFAKTLAREVKAARAEGIEVLVIRPGIDELKSLGTNAMRNFDRKALVDATRDAVHRLIDRNADHPALVQAMVASQPSRSMVASQPSRSMVASQPSRMRKAR
jgi:NTE family protein